MAEKKDTDDRYGKLRRVSVEIGEQGYIGSCEHEPAQTKGKDNMMSSCYLPDKKYALKDRADVVKFLDNALGFAPGKRVT